MRLRGAVIIRNDRGMAMLTVMILLLILTVLGIMAITVTALESRMSTQVLGQETAAAAAESCVGTAANIIQQTLAGSQLPANYYAAGGPVPASNAATLEDEIMAYNNSENNPDFAVGTGSAPNTQVQVGSFSVRGDIDRLYASLKAGSGIQSHAGYEGIGGGAGAGGVDLIYRVDCTAQNTATAVTNRAVAVYACTLTGEACQKKL